MNENSDNTSTPSEAAKAPEFKFLSREELDAMPEKERNEYMIKANAYMEEEHRLQLAEAAKIRLTVVKEMVQLEKDHTPGSLLALQLDAVATELSLIRQVMISMANSINQFLRSSNPGTPPKGLWIPRS